MRIQMFLSSTAMLAIKRYKEINFGNAPVPNGFVIELAYKNIEPEITKICWTDVNIYEGAFLSEIGQSELYRTQTTLNIDNDVVDKINGLCRDNLTKVFGTQKVYRPFAVKLILLAAVLHSKGRLPLIKK